MLNKKLLVCFAALLFACNAAALSAGPCLTPDACKAIMAHEIQIEYRGLLTSFLSDNLYALQNAATELKADNNDNAKLAAVADATVHLREIIENPQELNNEKLTQVIAEIKAHWQTIHEIVPDQTKYQIHLDRVAKAMHNLAESVIQGWTTTAIIAGNLKSEITGYDAIDTDVQKSKDLPFNATNLTVYNELMSRILQFFGVDSSIIYTS